MSDIYGNLKREECECFSGPIHGCVAIVPVLYTRYAFLSTRASGQDIIYSRRAVLSSRTTVNVQQLLFHTITVFIEQFTGRRETRAHKFQGIITWSRLV